MIHEFALEPTAISNWKDFRYFYDNFGIEHGRLISCFPRKWLKMVYEACNECSDMEKKRIEEKLKSMKGNKLFSFERPYNDNPKNTWLKNAEEQHLNRPFRAIVSSDNPRNHSEVLIAGDIDESTPLWSVKRGQKVPRTEADLSRCASMLLAISEEVLFVDPHFEFIGKKNGKPIFRFTKTLERLIAFAIQGKVPKRIELHVKHENDSEKNKKESLERWHRDCQMRLPEMIPSGHSMTVIKFTRKSMTSEKIHPRYVLTEKGGLQYDVGIDTGLEGETTDVTLLDRLHYEDRWSDYQKETSAFTIVDEFVVSGKSS